MFNKDRKMIFLHLLNCLIAFPNKGPLVFPNKGLHSIERFPTKVLGILLAIPIKCILFHDGGWSFDRIYGSRLKITYHLLQKLTGCVVLYIS